MSLGLLALATGAAGAQSATQEVIGQIDSTMTLTVDPTSVSEAFLVGTNTFSGGTLTVETNSLTASVDVAFDNTRMSEWDAAGGAYVSGGNQLANPLALAALDDSGTAVGTASSDTGGTLLGADLLGTGSHTFGLEYEQLVDLTDPAGTYRIEVTFTGSDL